MTTAPANRYFLSLLCTLLLFVIFRQVWYADYAYLDEAHEIWHRKDGSNFLMLFVQGRPVAGWIIHKAFASIDTIGALKWLRIISLFGWTITLLMFFNMLKKWVRMSGLHSQLIPIISILACCSCSVAIYIGWASCLEVFFAHFCGLLSGHVLFMALSKQDHARKLPVAPLIAAILLGLFALFTYQTAFGAFLLPFFLYYLGKRYQKPDRLLITGLVVYIAISILYFFLFKYSLKQGGVAASDRTGISTDLIGKIGFFFSTPLAQAFSFNFLYNISGIFSQVFYYGALAWWVVSVFIQGSTNTVRAGGFHILRCLGFLALIYLPIMVAKENFASYRTMFCLNIAGSILLIDALLPLLKNQKVNIERASVWGFCLFIVYIAHKNFNRNFINPLRTEYTVLRNEVQRQYSPTVQSIYFVRPKESLFREMFGVLTYRDEFGEPSTYKDWTPDPLLRQIITEITGNRKMAEEQIKVIHVADQSALTGTGVKESSTNIYIDMNLFFEIGR